VKAFLAATLLRVVRDAMPVQAPASASVISSTAVHGYDTGVSSGLNAGSVCRGSEHAAACCVVVNFCAADARSSEGGAAVCQV